jgi:hypothetical protein
MTKSALRLADDLTLPADAVTQTFAIFGKRGSGKTNGATVLVEELLTAHLPVVILDPVDAWWGLKASFNGKGPGFPIYVFGGAHGDLPLEASAGAMIADLVAHERLPLVLSMKLWSVGERARFVTDFAKRLLQVNTEPVMMVLEEADAFIPQRPGKGEEAMLGAMDRLVRWGRQSGVGCTIVTQRSAKVNKDVTTQAETLIAFRTTGPQDREAIDAWIKYHAGDEQRQEVLSTLPTLPNGTAWVWSPEWLGVLQKVAVRRRATFDSAATPKVGQKTTQPKKLASVDLERLRTQMAETVEKAKADDPRELRKTIAELKALLAKKQPTVANTQPTVAREKPVLTAADRALLDGIGKRIEQMATFIGRMKVDAIHGITEAIKDVVGDIVQDEADVSDAFLKQLDAKGFQKILGKLSTVSPQASPLAGRREELTSRAIPVSAPRRRAELGSRVRQSSSNGAGELSRMHRAMLIALAQHPAGLTKKQIHVHTGYASSGSTSAAFAELVREGWVDANGPLTITHAGLQVLGPFEPLPLGDDLREWLLAGDKLSTMEKSLLERICAAYPNAIAKGSVLEKTGYASSGSTSAAFAKLVAYHYAIPQGSSMLKAAEELFS